MNKTYRKTCVCILAGFLFASCADEAPVSGPAATRPLRCAVGIRGASGALVGTSDANELIRSYDLVFVEGEVRGTDGALTTPGTVHAVLHKDIAGEPVASDEFTARMTPGTYTVYAFGNLHPAYFSTLGITEGAPMPDLSGTLYPGTAATAPAGIPAAINGFTGQIPMSHRQDGVQVADRANQNCTIELVRMLAGMRFVFTNYASVPLTVDEVTVSPLTGSDIYLLRDPQADAAPQLPAAAFATQDFTHTVGLTLPADPAQKDSTAFYLKECSAIGHHPTDRFALTFRVTRGTPAAGGEATTDAAGRLRGETAAEYRYALTGDGLTYINRNDLVVLPIGFTDYVFSADVNFYPPIGGYPAAEITQDADDSFSCTFRSAGDFAIYPRLRNTAGSGEWVSVWDESRVQAFSMSVSDADGIFDRTPAVQAGEIVGTLGTQTGKARITLTVTLKPEAPSTVGRVLTCHIYIIRTNA